MTKDAPRHPRKPWLVAVVLALALMGAAPPPPPSLVWSTDYAAAKAIDQANADLQSAILGLHGRALTDADLKARLATLPPVQAALGEALATLTPHLRDVDARLAQLGPAPTAGQPAEDPQTAETRQSLNRARTAIDTEVKEAKLLTVEAGQISKALADRLRTNFSARLWARSRSVLNLGLWREFAAQAPGDVTRLATALSDQGAALSTASKRSGNRASLALALLAGLFLLGPGRALLNRFVQRRAERGPAVTPLRRAVLALTLLLIAALTVLSAGLLMRAVLLETGALTPVFERLTALLIRVAFFAAALEGMGRALLSPGRPDWRLAPISDAAVNRLAPYPALIGVAAGLTTFVGGLNIILGSSLSSSVASDCFAVLVELAVVGGALATVASARAARLANPRPTDGHSRLPWVLAAGAAWLAIAGALAAVLFGYLALASFLMRETVWIAAVLALLFLLLRLVDELFPALMSPTAPLGRAIETALGLSHGAMEQMGVLLSGMARLLLLLLGWTAILAPFGESADDLISRVTGADVVVHLGQVAISPGAVAGSLALFLAGLLVTRAVRGWLEVRYLPKTRLDVGLRTSVGAGVTYLGVLIAILVAFTYLGLSFSQIALFASALSVGIGFGLQGIIGNFVSGVILLAERPIQVGDWIAIGDLEGDVKRINIRATEIEMMDKSKLIVPNSDLVSKTVRNVTHSGAAGRVRIVLRVDDAADPALVRETLLARLTAHTDVLKDPAAAVYLTDVRDGALEFTAFAYVTSPRLAFRVRSELLFQIVPDLKGKGVGLANSTPIVNVAMPDRPIEPA